MLFNILIIYILGHFLCVRYTKAKAETYFLNNSSNDRILNIGNFTESKVIDNFISK